MHKMKTALAVVATGLLTRPVRAQEELAATPGTNMVETTRQAAQTMFEAVRDRDTGALTGMASQFLVPAVIALGVLVAGYLLVSFIGRTVGNLVSRRVDVTFGKFLSKAVRNALMALVLLGVLGYFGVDVTGFAAVIAALGFAIGMALQGTLGNFAAGIMLLVFRPFKVDDYIEVGGEEGVVEEIDLFTTRLNTRENLHKIVPNGQVFGATITNFSRNRYRRVDVNVGADYAADVDYTRAVLQTAISRIPGAVADPEPQVVLTALGDSSVNWQLRAWCRPEDFGSVRELLTVAAKKGMDLNGIGIPFPQLELHLADKLDLSSRAA